MESATLPAIDRRCKDCGTPIGPGREDRQYCDSACKTNYNNRRRKEKETQKINGILEEARAQPEPEQLSIPDYITRIQDVLLNNRRIMEGLCSEEKAGRVRMRDLIGKGFNTKFITSEAEPTESGRIYHFCFEYGYYEENGFAIVVCRKREVG